MGVSCHYDVVDWLEPDLGVLHRPCCLTKKEPSRTLTFRNAEKEVVCAKITLSMFLTVVVQVFRVFSSCGYLPFLSFSEAEVLPCRVLRFHLSCSSRHHHLIVKDCSFAFIVHCSLSSRQGHTVFVIYWGKQGIKQLNELFYRVIRGLAASLVPCICF